MLLMLDHWNNATEKNEDTITHNASEVIPIPPPPKDEAVVKEGENYVLSSNSNDKGLFSVV